MRSQWDFFKSKCKYWLIKCWVRCLQTLCCAAFVILAVIPFFAVDVIYDTARDEYWFPVCCDASSLKAWIPTDKSYQNFRQVGYSSTSHSGPSPPLVFPPLKQKFISGCPDQLPVTEHLSECWANQNGSDVWRIRPTHDHDGAALLQRMMVNFVCGLLLGSSPFILCCLIVVCRIPKRSKLE